MYADGQLLVETACNMSLKGAGAQGSYFAIGQFAGLNVPGGCPARFAEIRVYAHPLSERQHELMCHPAAPVPQPMEVDLEQHLVLHLDATSQGSFRMDGDAISQ